MIISCTNCTKKFDINSDLIPEGGRLLECGGCNHQWFFQKEISKNVKENTNLNNNFVKNPAPEDEQFTLSENLNDQKLFNKDLQDKTVEEDFDDKPIAENEKKIDLIKNNVKRNNKILNKTLVFIISFVALIILVDTFKEPISKIIPNIEFLLYSLYETLKDIILFFKDLI
jgi:predicted Zn finger-like uncharacterized protein